MFLLHLFLGSHHRHRRRRRRRQNLRLQMLHNHLYLYYRRRRRRRLHHHHHLHQLYLQLVKNIHQNKLLCQQNHYFLLYHLRLHFHLLRQKLLHQTMNLLHHLNRQ
ncbi:MAG: hypothetical protein IPF58_17195 [Saprospirales bacterium]|nr:hypothetical protein [Saprospirales bacterium]